MEIFSVKMSGGGVVQQPKNLPDFRPQIYPHFLVSYKFYLVNYEFFLVNYEEMAKNAY